MSKQAQALTFFPLVIITWIAVLIQPGLAQLQIPQVPGLFPPGASGSGEVMQCWSSLVNIQGCAWEIYRSVLTQQFNNIGPSCCKAYLEIDAQCWPKMFPFNPFFPPLFKVLLVQPGVAQFQVPQFPGVSPPGSSGSGYVQCWSSLVNIQGCAWEIYRSVFTLQFDNIGPSCCRAYLEIDAQCWPKMFPYNPFFPPLFKGYCTRIAPPLPSS
ncbi:ECA1 gametogenesis related family protein [Melia azedarach]|uniref:ECA1 gametogenesis related family protein n=1 Tax=Melia azedarach TaxID=155640 RepID=A0ACC1XD09_MELAZ|nr:ECA1 gametogenesis related family protein [Melia azedarach]